MIYTSYVVLEMPIEDHDYEIHVDDFDSEMEFSVEWKLEQKNFLEALYSGISVEQIIKVTDENGKDWTEEFINNDVLIQKISKEIEEQG
jgi:hypothetical protein